MCFHENRLLFDLRREQLTLDQLTTVTRSLKGSYGPGVHAALTAFYEEHAPETVSRVDEVLDAYGGRERLLFERLLDKYGDAPRALLHADDARRSELGGELAEFYAGHAPERVERVGALLGMYVGHERVLYERLLKKYGEAPPGLLRAAEAAEEAVRRREQEATQIVLRAQMEAQTEKMVVLDQQLAQRAAKLQVWYPLRTLACARARDRWPSA